MSDSCVGAGNSLLHHHITNLVVLTDLLIIKFVSCIAMYPEVPDSYLMTQTSRRTVGFQLFKKTRQLL
jgi:hypothetical protein